MGRDILAYGAMQSEIMLRNSLCGRIERVVQGI